MKNIFKPEKIYNLSKSEELKECLDTCCGVKPTVIVTDKILIKCLNCPSLISINGSDEDFLYRAMIQWNLIIRRLK